MKKKEERRHSDTLGEWLGRNDSSQAQEYGRQKRLELLDDPLQFGTS